MGDLGEAVDLVHELRELRAAEELFQGRDHRLGVDEILGHGRGQVGADGHLLLDGPLHAGQADPEGVLDELADRAHPPVAQMVDVVHFAFALFQQEEVLDDLDVIERPQELFLEGRVELELDVHLQPADPGEGVFLRIEEQVAEEVLGALGGVGFARTQLPVDLGQRRPGVFLEVLFERVADDRPRLVLLGEEDLERLGPADEEVETGVAELLVRLDLAFDDAQGIGALELLLDERHPGDALVLELPDDLRRELLLGCDDDLLGRGGGDVVGRCLARQVVRELPKELPILRNDPVNPMEQLDDLLVGPEPEGPQEDRDQEFLLPVEPDVERVLGVVLEFDPGAAVRDDLADEEPLVLPRPEKHAGRALELADHDPLDPVENERALFGHERDVAEIDLLLLDVLQPLGFAGGVLLPGDQAPLQPQGDREGVALLQALVGRVLELEVNGIAAVLAARNIDLPHRGTVGADLLLGQLHAGREQRVAGLAPGAGVLHSLEAAAPAFPVADGVADEIELGRLLEIGDRKDVLEGRLQAGVLPLLRQQLHLQELGIGLPLDGQQVGHRKLRPDLGEVGPLKAMVGKNGFL